MGTARVAKLILGYRGGLDLPTDLDVSEASHPSLGVRDIIAKEIKERLRGDTTNLKNKFTRELLFKGSESFPGFIERLLPEVATDKKQRKQLQIILDLLIRQTDDNPVFYASHGTDHGLRTMDICVRLRQVFDIKVSELDLALMCLLHDVGYVGLATDGPAPHKSLHAYAGMKMVEQSGVTISPEALEAIGFHNYDTAQTSEYKAPDTDLFQGPFGLWAGTKPGYIKRYSVPANFDDTPLLAILRVADNLEVSAERLALFQNHRFTMRVLLFLWARAVTEGVAEKAHDTFSELNLDAAIDYAICKEFKDKIPERNRISTATIRLTFREIILPSIPKILHNQFPHWYSNYIVKSARLGSDLVLTITFRDDVPEDLKWYNHIPWCMYQITRAAEACTTVSVDSGGESLDQVVTVAVANCRDISDDDDSTLAEACNMLEGEVPHTLDYFASKAFMGLTAPVEAHCGPIEAVGSEDLPSPKGIRAVEDEWAEMLPAHEDMSAVEMSLEQQLPQHKAQPQRSHLRNVRPRHAALHHRH